MDTANTSLLAEVVACRHIVDDYAKRLDDACVEYYETGKTLFPNLSRAEDEDMDQRCKRVLESVASIAPDALNQWNAITYPIDQYKEQVERMRDIWIRRRNLLRTLETSLRTRLELGKGPQAQDDRESASMVKSEALNAKLEEQVEAFFLPKLQDLGLTKEQLASQDIASLASSLETLNDALANPGSFGTFGVAKSDYHLEIRRGTPAPGMQALHSLAPRSTA